MDSFDLFNEFITGDRKFWLPKNSTWNEIIIYNKFNHKISIVYPILVAVLIYLIRLTFERFIAEPIGKWLNIKDKQSFTPNALLEAHFRENSVLSDSVALFIAKQTDLKFEYVKEWFESRRMFNKPSKLKKFKESFWRFFFYSSIWTYGLVILIDKPWFWDTKECWINYPKQPITSDIYWYYLIELSFYLSLLVTQFFDIKRKDFWQMFIHHLVTISLILFSYACNLVRIGTLVLLIHDCADILLEFAKMGTYACLQRLCDATFILFTLTWFVTRLVVYPTKILYTTTVIATEHLGFFPAFYFFNVLLLMLQVMHIIWFYMICRIAHKAILNGKMERDDRSESDDQSTHEHNQ